MPDEARFANLSHEAEKSVAGRFCSTCGGVLEDRPCSACRDTDSPQATRSPGHHAKHGLGGLLLFYFLLLGVILTAVVVSLVTGEEGLGIELPAAVVMAGVVSLFAVIHRSTLVSAMRWPSLRIWAYVAASAVLTLGVGWGFVELLVRGAGFIRLDNLELLRARGYTPMWLALLYVLYPAIVEEVAFRGIIQPRLASILSRREAVVVTAAVFAIVHIVIAVPQFVLGLCCGWIRDKSDSLWPAIVLHGLHNAGTLLIAYWIETGVF